MDDDDQTNTHVYIAGALSNDSSGQSVGHLPFFYCIEILVPVEGHDGTCQKKLRKKTDSVLEKTIWWGKKDREVRAL